MAEKKYKAPVGMDPRDAADWEKYGSFVHHFEGGGMMLGPDGKPFAPAKTTAKKTTKKKTVSKKKAK